MEVRRLPNDVLEHHGVKGQHWGERRWQNEDGSLTPAGRAHYGYKTVFVSGSSKTTDPNSIYYQDLNSSVKRKLKKYMKKNDKIIVGDAPGVDSQVQDYLAKKEYDNVEVYGVKNGNKNVRYLADNKWKTHGYKTKVDKDIAMSNAADEALAMPIKEGGSRATRENIKRLSEMGKKVVVKKLSYNLNSPVFSSFTHSGDINTLVEHLYDEIYSKDPNYNKKKKK